MSMVYTGFVEGAVATPSTCFVCRQRQYASFGQFLDGVRCGEDMTKDRPLVFAEIGDLQTRETARKLLPATEPPQRPTVNRTAAR